MAELDTFEARLAAAVRAFADRADTRVDAIAVANRAIGRRRFASLSWLGHPLPVRVSVLLVLALLLALLAWSTQVGAPWGIRTSLVPPSAPTATPADAALIPTPRPSTDGTGAEYVTGTEVLGVRIAGSDETVGDVEQVRGRTLATTDTMNDPRVSGKGTVQFNGDFRGLIGTEWGTYRLENPGGAWEGRWTGATWNSGTTDVTGWLVGSGAYAGFTYYIHLWGTDGFKVEGVIFPGSPPTP